MRVSGQKVNTAHGEYTVIVGGGSEAVEATARTVALLLACGAPVIVGVAAAASYWLVRRSLESVDAIRSRVAEISASDLTERVPVPGSRDEISALAVTMNEMLARIEAGHRAQQRFVGDASHELRSPLTTIISGLEAAEHHPELLSTELASKILLPEAHRMRTLIDDLLLLARADEKRLVIRKEEISARRSCRCGSGSRAAECELRNPYRHRPGANRRRLDRDLSSDTQLARQCRSPRDVTCRRLRREPGATGDHRHQRRWPRHRSRRSDAGVRTLCAS